MSGLIDFSPKETLRVRGIGYNTGNNRITSIRALALTVVTTTALVGLFCVSPSDAQSQAQSAAAAPAIYEYDVVSVKPSSPASIGKPGNGTSSSPDAFTARSSPLVILVDYAFGIRNPAQLAGAPDWISNERFDVDAKMESSVMDALQKLSRNDRTLARQQMLQTLLADRFKLAVHRETRELPVYNLVIAKSGAKLKEAKPGDTYANGAKDSNGSPMIGGIIMSATAEGENMTGQAVPMAYFVQILSREAKRIVVDKTGLSGNFDFSLQFMTDQFALQGEPGSTSPLPASDPGAPSLFTALQEQLGLKLETGKAPIEVIVIDHIERPSGN